jgi:oxygen-independent coproporphyrinogen-3 oxidase
MSLGIYIQVPFCQTKCTYCNFHTGVVSPARFAPYAAAVQTEMRDYRRRLPGSGVVLPASFSSLIVDTVYIGGGTPSLLDPAHLAAVLDTIRDTFQTALSEVTLEADPETVDQGKAVAWVASGINRISFGVQSFSDAELKAAGRMHRRADVYRAVPILRAAGIANMSFDLIAGLPHQAQAGWQNSLAELIHLEPEHVSIYLLEVDEGSRLGSELLRGGRRYSAAAVPKRRPDGRVLRNRPRRIAARGLRAVRNLQLRQARFRLETQPQVLASRALFGLWGGSALLFRIPALGQCP